MKAINTKRWLSVLLVLCMAASLFVTPALAAQDVRPNPGSGTIPVEYFTSTLYQWDEDKANAATMEADRQTGGVLSAHPTVREVREGYYYQENTLLHQVTVNAITTQQEQYNKVSDVTYSDLLRYNSTQKIPTNYYYLINGSYYQVYVTRTSSWDGEYTYNLFAGDNYEQVHSETTRFPLWTDVGVDLYQKERVETTTYQLMANEEPLEGGKTYSRLSDRVATQLYYQSTATGYEGKGFYFTNAGSKPNETDIPSFSSWTDNNQNYFIYSGLAEKYLDDATNAPFSNENVNAANLFATDSSNEAYTEVYKNVKVPFVYDETTGYYTLNSDLNAVYFKNGEPADGATMAIADRPAVFYQYVKRTENTDYYGTGFQPFNRLQSEVFNQNVTMCAGTGTTRGYKTTPEISADETNSEILDKHYGFGMVTEVPFQMTDSGTDAKGQDIVFTFSGDDDVWVYVDGVLALDIGGTHDAIFGEINFRTGEVTLTAPYYGEIGDKNAANNPNHSVDDQYTSRKLYQTNLYDALGTTRTGFAAKGQHTLTVYYMDRGRGSTNCVIEFNLPQRDSVSVTKHVEEYYTGMDVTIPDDVKNTPFTFQLLNDGYPVSYKAYTLYNASNEIEGSGTTSGTGTFTLTNGQRAVFQNISLDDPQTWQVIETLPGDLWSASWQATSSVTTAGIGSADGATSGLVTVQGSDTASDSISFVCTNSYEYKTDVSLDVQNESVVIDYGLPVEVDVLANDSVTGNGEITGFEIKTDGLYGTADIDTESGNLVYTLNQMLSKIDTVTYTVHARDIKNDETFDKDGTLTIIPATSMYYEESFGPQSGDDRAIIYQTNTENWSPISDDKPYGTYQETALVGGSSSTYGTDPVYLNNLRDSYGTSRKADVASGAAQIQYDFTGTGTAIYGRITLNSAYIMVEITNKDTNSVVDKQYIDTVVLTNGSNSSNLSTLYNIPIYNNDTLEYGSYHVRVYIYKAGTPTTHGGSGNEFYLDGIRVYCPLGDQSSEAFPTVADQAYSGHGEANVVTANIRYKLTNDGCEGGTFATLTDVDGEITDLDRYGEIGPNEELYLKEGYSVTFAIKNWNSQQYKMFLGMKAPDGKENVRVRVGSQTYSIGNSADCYYEISNSIVTDTDGVSYVTITGDNGLVSLTNIKVTGTDAYKIITSGTDSGPTDPYMLTFMSVALASSMNGSTEPPVEETPVFEPDRVKTSCVYSRLLRVATVTVTASKDVDYVTINGRTVNGVSLFGSKYFTRSCTGISKGEEIEVVCYNSDGVASQTYTVTAK